MLCDNSISSVVMMDNNQELSNKAFFSYNGVNAQWSWVKILFSSLFVIHSLDAAASKHFFLYYCSIESFSMAAWWRPFQWNMLVGHNAPSAISALQAVDNLTSR